MKENWRNFNNNKTTEKHIWKKMKQRWDLKINWTLKENWVLNFQIEKCFAMNGSWVTRDSLHFSEGWSQDIFSRCQEIRGVHNGHLYIHTNTSICNYTTWSNNEQNSLQRAFAYRGNVEQLTTSVNWGFSLARPPRELSFCTVRNTKFPRELGIKKILEKTDISMNNIKQLENILKNYITTLRCERKLKKLQQ